MALSVTEQLTQLDAARQLVLGDAAFYPKIVQGILPIVGANTRLELRRWGAEFLAETFASPSLASQQKESLSIPVLQTLHDLLEVPDEDTGVVKSVIQAAASIYGLVFRYIISNPGDVQTWNKMAAIKSNILKRWDTAATGVRVCCIKFVQKVVQVQTPGVIADPRRPDQNEISLALVPRDHPLIPAPRLEPEASGLLDRLLNVFHEDLSDAVLVNATLNCLGVLLRTRPSIANKIISVILNFNPLKRTNSPMSPKDRVQIKSMERTTRVLLMNVYRRNENGPTAGRIKVYIDRLAQTRLEIFDEGGAKKRALPSEPTDGLDNAKRRRLGAELSGQSRARPLPPGPNSFAQLYTLTDDSALASFDAWQLPEHLVTRVTLGLLAHIDAQSLDRSINDIRSRFLSLSKVGAGMPQPGALGDDEEDYEPDFEPQEDREQIINKADDLPPDDSIQVAGEVALGPFTLPHPPPLTTQETDQLGRGIIDRVFSMMNVLEESTAARKQKPGLNRLAGSNYDREAWVTLITRLATRASAGLENEDEVEEGSKAVVKKPNGASSLSDGIREILWKFIVENFRAKIGLAIAWLNEEWFNDCIQQQVAVKKGGTQPSTPPRQHYEKWTLRVLDGIVPYLDAKDKLLLRFLSEIPVVSENVLERVKGLARDPERVDLAVKAIHYLILMKPPAREICLDAVEDLWRNYDDAKAPTTKLLMKWRPHVLPPATKHIANPTTNGVQSPVDTKDSPTPHPSTASAADGEQMKSPQTGVPLAAAG